MLEYSVWMVQRKVGIEEKTFHSNLLRVATHKRHKLGHLRWSKNELEPLKSSACTRLVFVGLLHKLQLAVRLREATSPLLINISSQQRLLLHWLKQSFNKQARLSLLWAELEGPASGSGPHWRHQHILDAWTNWTVDCRWYSSSQLKGHLTYGDEKEKRRRRRREGLRGSCARPP